MPKTREQKQKIIEDLKEKIASQKAMVLLDFAGLDSKVLFQLRDKLKESNCLLRVVKKTLLKKVLEALKEKKLAEKIDEIAGQLALVFGFEDEILPTKICYKFSQANENLKILGGVLDREFLAKAKIIELAQAPSRPELLARLIGSLSMPISRFMNILQGNIKGLICILANIKA